MFYPIFVSKKNKFKITFISTFIYRPIEKYYRLKQSEEKSKE